MKKVLFIAYFFPPAAGAGVQRTARHVKYLRESGYEPVVVAPDERTFIEDPLSHGIDRSFQAELPKDLTIYRVPCTLPFRLVRLLKKLKLLWLYSLVVRPDDKLFWCAGAVRTGLQAGRREKVALIYQNVGPWSTVFTGLILKCLLRKPWVLDIRDPWTHWILGVWPTRLHFILERLVERHVLGCADAISCLGKTYRAELLTAHPALDRNRVVVIPNGYDRVSLEATAPSPRRDTKLRIVHAGKFYDTWGETERGRTSAVLKALFDYSFRLFHYRPQDVRLDCAGPRYLLAGLAAMREADPEAAAQIEIELIGKVDRRVQRHARLMGLEGHIRLTGVLPHDECVAHMRAADVMFLPMYGHADGRPMGCLLLKLYEYLATGKPILAAVPPGDQMEVLQRAGTAFLVRADDPAMFRDRLFELYRMHRNGGIAVRPDWEYIRLFDRRLLARRLAALFDATLELSAKDSATVLERPMLQDIG